MSDQEILEKAIKKAEANNEDFDWTKLIPSLSPFTGRVDTSLIGMMWLCRHAIIFNHDFAKALWGDLQVFVAAVNPPDGDLDEDGAIHANIVVDNMPNYKYLLQQMVIADDPIEYLGEHL